MTQGGGSSSHRNPRIDALHGQSTISLPPSRFHQRMHYSWSIKYITVHPHSIYAPEKLYVIPSCARWLVGAINLPRTLYSRSVPRCCIHKTTTILPQKLHWSSMTRQYCHNQNFYAPVTNSRASTTFRSQDPACKIEFRTILCLRYTLPPSTTLT